MANFRNAMMAAAYTASASGVTIEKSALFNSANSEDLSRSGMSGTATTWTASFWVYRGDNGQRGSATAKMMFTTASDAGLSFGNNSTADVLAWYSGSYTATTAVFRDIGWYHMVVKNVAGTGTVYVNGVEMLSSLTVPTADATMAIGSYNNSSSYFDGYISQFAFVDGTAKNPSDFADASTDGNYWTPKSDADVKAIVNAGGSNSFLLDNSSNAETDSSSKSNSFQNNNTVTTSTHTPSNLNALWNPLSTVGLTTRFPQLSAGNTTAGFSGSTSARAMLTFPVFYNTHLEFTVTQGSGGSTDYPYLQVFPYSTDDYNGDILVSQPAAGGSGGTGLASGASIPNWTTGDRVTLEIDTTNGRIYVFIDGSAVNSANPSAGSGFTFDFTMPASGQLAIVWISQTSAGKTVVVSNPAEFTDSVSTGYKGLTSTEIAKSVTLPTSTIDDHFRTILYTGNGSTQTITTTIRPDFIWTKNRTSSGPAIVDAVRGPTKSVQTNSSGNEFTSSNSITSLGATSYDLGSDGDHGSFNDNTDAHVAWVAQLGGVPSATNSAGAGATPTAGSVKIDGSNLGSALAGTIPVTKLSASTEFGMSVISYTGNGSAGATIAHGLSATPTMYWVKGLDGGDHFYVYHSGKVSDAETDALLLNGTSAGFDDATVWNDTKPTSSVISLGTSTGVNQSGKKYVAVAFKPSNFISIGSYKSNANVDGPFAPTSKLIPMRPKWVMIKDTGAASQWWMWDDKRSPNNLCTKVLYANLANAEDDSVNISLDMVNGGFKLRTSSNPNGNSGNNFVYLAFGQPIISKDKTLLAGR